MCYPLRDEFWDFFPVQSCVSAVQCSLSDGSFLPWGSFNISTCWSVFCWIFKWHPLCISVLSFFSLWYSSAQWTLLCLCVLGLLAPLFSSLSLLIFTSVSPLCAWLGSSLREVSWGSLGVHLICLPPFRDHFLFIAWCFSVLVSIVSYICLVLFLLFQVGGYIWFLLFHLNWKPKPLLYFKGSAPFHVSEEPMLVLIALLSFSSCFSATFGRKSL